MKALAVFALALVVSTGAMIDTAHARTKVEKEAGSFSSTGTDPDARGTVKLQVRDDSDGRLEVRVQKLERRATYDVLLDGVLIGTIRTRGGGSGGLRFRSRPRNAKDALLGFDPRGALLVIRDAAGHDVLGVALADSGAPGAGDVVCCVPDDGGPDCEDRTPEECAAEGGTVSTATSCLPNPCAGTPPPAGGDVICCVPDDSGPECEDRTADECAAEGGVVVQATSCTPNPCEPAVPPADGDVQCCLADDSGAECEDRTPAECAVEGGVNAGAGSCTPNPCESIPQPAGGSVEVKCEVRANRSKISVEGENLPAASYQARVASGVNVATAPARPTIGDEVEFDFDSDGGDIAEGATPIAPTFIQGAPPQVTGEILNGSGGVVASATVDCLVK